MGGWADCLTSALLVRGQSGQHVAQVFVWGKPVEFRFSALDQAHEGRCS
jgi:hypothetical protein